MRVRETTGRARRWALTGAVALAISAATAWATDPRASDGGLNDLVIYLASDHPQGVPEVEFRALQADLRRRAIAIPPALHVHRYYYNGNKEFQGPFVVGGPTMIVANHPKTNEKVYVEAQLPSGYPEIAYDPDSITYIYPERRVQIRFLHLCPETFSVSYLPGRGAARHMHETGRAAAERRQERRLSSPVRKSIAQARQGLKDTTRGIAKSTGTVIGQGANAVGQAISAAPGIRTFQSRGRQAQIETQEARFRTAVERAKTPEPDFVPTLR